MEEEQKEGKVLWEREMIDPEKRELLKSMGFKQLLLHDTPVFGPAFREIVEQSDLIPSNAFYNQLQGGVEVIYGTIADSDKMIISDKDKGFMQIDDGMPYNWERGIERLKKLLKDKENGR